MQTPLPGSDNELFPRGSLRLKLARVWLSLFAGSLLCTAVMSTVHAVIQGGGFVITVSNSAWTSAEWPWYDRGLLFSMELAEWLILYPLGYAILVVIAIFVFGSLVDDPKDGEIVSPARKGWTYFAIFGVPLLLQVALSLWLHGVFRST